MTFSGVLPDRICRLSSCSCSRLRFLGRMGCQLTLYDRHDAVSRRRPSAPRASFSRQCRTRLRLGDDEAAERRAGDEAPARPTARARAPSRDGRSRPHCASRGGRVGGAAVPELLEDGHALHEREARRRRRPPRVRTGNTKPGRAGHLDSLPRAACSVRRAPRPRCPARRPRARAWRRRPRTRRSRRSPPSLPSVGFHVFTRRAPDRPGRLDQRDPSRSMISAMPWPPPMHAVATPKPPSRSSSSRSSITTRRAPDAPSG
jgi:hypothetical protein